MVETDVRRNSSGVLVLSHDPIGPADHHLQLTDLLQALPAFPFNLEIKNFPGEPDFDPDHGTALATAELARGFDLLTCFFWPSVDLVRRRYPAIATGLLVDVGWDLTVAARHELEVGHRALVAHWSVILAQPDQAVAAAAAGLDLMVWTLNDPSFVSKLTELGVSAVITDDPGAMTAYLRDSS